MSRAKKARSPGGALPNPPPEYDSGYLARLVQRLGQLEQALFDLGDAQMSTLYVTNMPTTGNCLRAGDVFESGGVVKIVLDNDKYAPSLSSTLSLGTVTVSIS